MDLLNQIKDIDNAIEILIDESDRVNRYGWHVHGDIKKLYELKQTAYQALDKLPIHERNIIYLRYFQGKTWEEMAEQLNYTDRHLRRLHQKAVKTFKDVLECPGHHKI